MSAPKTHHGCLPGGGHLFGLFLLAMSAGDAVKRRRRVCLRCPAKTGGRCACDAKAGR
jgi:hypothetical protein